MGLWTLTDFLDGFSPVHECCQQCSLDGNITVNLGIKKLLLFSQFTLTHDRLLMKCTIDKSINHITLNLLNLLTTFMLSV